MKTYTLSSSSITRILPPNTTGRKRWVTVQASPINTTNVALQFDGDYNPANPALSASNGFILTPGQSETFSSTAWGGTEAEKPFDAIGASGGEVVNVQTATFNNQS